MRSDRGQEWTAPWALARFGDPRALAACIAALGSDPGTIALLTVQTAAVLADAALLPHLTALHAEWSEDQPGRVETVAAPA